MSSSSSIVDLFNAASVTYFDESGHHHARGGWVQIDCPFCGKGSQRFHMGFNKQRGSFSCWRCGFHPTVATLQALGIDRKEAIRWAKAYIDTSFPVKTSQRRGKLVIPRGLQSLKDVSPALQYCRKRGLCLKDLVNMWEVQAFGVAVQYSWRLFIPIHYKGEVVSWTTRSLKSDAEKRYLSASQDHEIYNHKHLLYGEDLCSFACVVVEGPVDVWKFGAGACATFGTSYTREQLLKLASYPLRVVCYDSSNAAQAAAQTLIDELSVFEGETYNVVLDAKDLGEASEREIRKLKKLVGVN